MDSLLSTVQMPAGIPVATVAIGNAGAKNAAYLAAQILGLSDKYIAQRLKSERENNAKLIAQKAGAMVDKFVGFSEDILKISKQFDILQSSFHAAQNKLSTGKGNLVRQAQQLKELGAQASKEIPKAMQEK